MSILKYNGITLPYSSNTYYNQEPVYDPVGGVDHYLTRYEISVTTVINASYAALLDGGALTLIDNEGEFTATNPAQVMMAIRARLEQPRRALSYKFNEVELIPQPPQGIQGTVDAKNGPITKCQAFLLTNETFMIRFHVIAHYREKNTTTNADGVTTTTNQTPPAVIFNRWTESVMLDESGYSKRLRKGRFVIRSDNPEGLAADYYRNSFATCSIPKGFVRESSQYDISPDGLGIQYQIVDREVYKLPPSPAFEARGKYIETATELGAIRYGEVNLNLRAAKDVSQVSLIDTAIGVAAAKLITVGAMRATGNQKDATAKVTMDGKDGFGVLVHAVIVVDMYDNMVDVSLRVMLAAQTLTGNSSQRIHSIAGLSGGKTMAYTPGSETTTGTPIAPTPPYTIRGTASLLLRAASYFDPTLTDKDNALGRALQVTNTNNLVPSSDGKTGNAVQTRGGAGIEPGEAAKKPERRMP